MTKNFLTLAEFAGDDWKDIVGDGEKIAALVALRSTDLAMKEGRIPKDYTKTVHCENCGEVKLWEGSADKVLGCPWCHIRKEK